MSLNECVFAAQITDARELSVIEARLQALAGFYEPLGIPTTTLRYAPELRLAYGAIALDRDAALGDDLLEWGGSLPAELPRAEDVLGASDRDLRRLDAVLAVVAVGAERAEIVTGTTGLTALYTARCDEVQVWATHAVAAGMLARGELAVDARGLPELLGLAAVADARTLLEGVTALSTATRVTVSADRVLTRSNWPPTERWAQVPEHEAYDHAEAALLESLGSRVRGSASLGLTAGADSRVVAVALQELGADFTTHTWGGERSADVAGAEWLARELGLSHRRLPHLWHDDDGALAFLDRAARRKDGVTGGGFIEETWPPELAVPCVVTGLGGETGRAFHYGSITGADPAPDARALSRVLSFEAPLAGAEPEAIARLRERVAAWIADAEDLGYRGWRCLDVLYTEQRVRRWGRATLPQAAPALLPALLTPELSRALVSLPLADRLRDGFDRRFVGERRPELAPPEPSRDPQRRPLRTRSRPVASLASLARPITRRLRGAAPASRWYAAGAWETRPKLRSFVAEEVLCSPLVIDGLGDDWARSTRAAFLRDEALGTRLALQRALRDTLARSPHHRHARIAASPRREPCEAPDQHR